MMQWRHHCGFGIDRSVVLPPWCEGPSSECTK